MINIATQCKVEVKFSLWVRQTWGAMLEEEKYHPGDNDDPVSHILTVCRRENPSLLQEFERQLAECACFLEHTSVESETRMYLDL